MSGDDSRPSLRAPALETVFRPFPLASPSGPLYIERMFLLRLRINQSIRYLHLYRSLYSNSCYTSYFVFPFPTEVCQGTCTENGSGNRPNPEPRHNIHRCPSGNPEDVNGRTGTGTEIRGGSETAHRYTSKSSAGHHHRDQMVPGARRRGGQRKGRRMGQACSRRAGHSRRGRLDLLGPAGGDTAPQIPCQHQEGDLGEEVDGGSTVGRRPDLQKEVQDAEKPEAGRHGCWEHQEACLKVLPAEDGALPYW